MRRGRGEAAPVSVGTLRGRRGPHSTPPRLPLPGASLTPPSSPGPPQPPRPGSAHSPLPPLWASPRHCSHPFPVSWPRMFPGAARLQLSGPLWPGPSGASWWAWARPGLGASSRPRGRLGLPGPFPEPLVFRLFLSPIPGDPSPPPRPLGSPPRPSVPEVPSRCPGLRVLLRLGRRCRGRSHGPASRPSLVCVSRSVPHRHSAGRIGALSLPALRLA